MSMRHPPWRDTVAHACGERTVRLRALFLRLPHADRPEFDIQVDRHIALLLPVLGPLLGAFVIVFGGWDAWIDPTHAGMALALRIALVLAGAPAYADARLQVRTRCFLLYATHAGAMTVAAGCLEDGLVLALPGLTGALFILALVEPRPLRWMASTLTPALLYLALAASELPLRSFLSGALLYLVSWLLAAAVAAMNLQRWRRTFLAEKALLHASRYDSLSGALSRGYVTELAMRDVALARRHDRPLAIAMLDIDHFKRVNDTYGHHTGDLVLRAMAQACTLGLRASDYFGRIGGEEFVCVMPEASPEDALACAERMRLAIAALQVPTDAGPLHVTVSLGVAVLDHRHDNWESLLRAADAALYRAKTAGRNQTMLAPGTANASGATLDRG